MSAPSATFAKRPFLAKPLEEAEQKRVLEKSKSDAVILRASLTRQGQQEQQARRHEQQRLREARSAEALHRKESTEEKRQAEVERARLARCAPHLICSAT